MDTSDQDSVASAQASKSRKMPTREEKRRILEEATAPGASVVAVARQHRVNANLAFAWRRLHQRGLPEGCREPAELLPVKVMTPTVLPDRESRPAKDVEPPPRRKGSGRIEIEMPGGVEGLGARSDRARGSRRGARGAARSMIALPAGVQVWLPAGATRIGSISRRAIT
jgi:transposase